MDRLAGGLAAAESAAACMGNVRRTSILCRHRYLTRTPEEVRHPPTRAQHAWAAGYFRFPSPSFVVTVSRRQHTFDWSTRQQAYRQHEQLNRHAISVFCCPPHVDRP